MILISQITQKYNIRKNWEFSRPPRHLAAILETAEHWGRIVWRQCSTATRIWPTATWTFVHTPRPKSSKFVIHKVLTSYCQAPLASNSLSRGKNRGKEEDSSTDRVLLRLLQLLINWKLKWLVQGYYSKVADKSIGFW